MKKDLTEEEKRQLASDAEKYRLRQAEKLIEACNKGPDALESFLKELADEDDEEGAS